MTLVGIDVVGIDVVGIDVEADLQVRLPGPAL
jgi:hypothetical protein